MFEDLHNGTVRYTGCGLDYVILHNGFTLKTFGGETAISIAQVDALWNAIARAIVGSKPRLEGQDGRFLRAKMKLTQAELAKAFNVTRQTIIGWEQRPNAPIPETPDRLLRLIYDAQSDSGIFGTSTVQDLTNLKTNPNSPIGPFEHKQADWQPTSPAS